MSNFKNLVKYIYVTLIFFVKCEINRRILSDFIFGNLFLVFMWRYLNVGRNVYLFLSNDLA